MFKDKIYPALLLAGFLLVTQGTDSSDQPSDPKPMVAVVNYGQILFDFTEITAYRQNANGVMVPSPDLSESEIKTLAKVTKNIKTAIDEIRIKYGFSMVIRQNDDPRQMEIPMASARWKPDSKNPIRVMTDEERRVKKRNALFLDLEQRIVSRGKVNITEMVIEKMKMNGVK